MACILSSSKVWLELLVRSWNTTLQSSASPVYAQNHTWFEAWKPAQDGLSVVIRQPSVKAQYYALMCLQRWMQGNEILHLNWPERNIDYDGSSWNNDYSNFPRRVCPFFIRGGSFVDGGEAGVFYFYDVYGGSNEYGGFRVVAL